MKDDFKADEIERLENFNAFLNEVMRHSGFPGALLNRDALKDIDICGLHIVKGTTVTALVASNYYDERFFPQPH